jgi:hypothetical protein
VQAPELVASAAESLVALPESATAPQQRYPVDDAPDGARSTVTR